MSLEGAGTQPGPRTGLGGGENVRFVRQAAFHHLVEDVGGDGLDGRLRGRDSDGQHGFVCVDVVMGGRGAFAQSTVGTADDKSSAVK